MNKEYTNGGLAAIILCNIGWGLCDILIAIIARGYVVTWIHGLSGAIFLVAAMLLTKQKLSFSDFIKAFPIGLHRAIVWGILFIAFQQDNPTIAITLLSFSLIVSIVVFGPKLGEKVTAKILFFASIGVMGVILTSLDNLNSFVFTTGAILGLIALPISAAGTYILRRVQTQVPPRTTPAYMFIWVSIIYTPILFIVEPELNFSNKEFMIIALMAVLGGGGHFLFSISQTRTTFRFNAIASSIHTPATAIFAWLILDDILAPHQIAGMVIVTLVVVYVAMNAKKRDTQKLVENLEAEI